MNRDLQQQQFAIRELRRDSVLIRGVGTLKDPIAERLRQQVLRLMGERTQREVVRLCDSPYVRIDQVHKLVKGDLPFPPLTFLDTLLRAFGSSLREALEKDPPVRPLPITRADVRAVAQLLMARSDAYVASVGLQAKEVARAQPNGRRRGSRRAPEAAAPRTPTTRSNQRRRAGRGGDET